MSEGIPVHLRRLVVRRARGLCEYCRLSQEGQEATFHVDHVKPAKDGGETVPGNLALACVSCSLRKAARQTAVDPETGVEVPLFHPRRELWPHHFHWDDVVLLGRTATGRATIDALRLNRPSALAIRLEEKVFGRHPPPAPVPVSGSSP